MDKSRSYVYDSEAPFNMAVATLMRLDAILQQIRILDYQYPFDSPEKQKSYLGLVKQFYINSIPLLDDEEAKKHLWILRENIETRNLIKRGNQKSIPRYDSNLDLKLNKLLIVIQQTLKKFFMPKGKDKRRAVAVMN